MKNNYEIRGEVTVIFLKSNKFGNMETLIDTKDLERVNNFFGSLCIAKSKLKSNFYVVGYARIDGKQSMVLLHRYVMEATSLDIDHINHDTLDNRKSCNLRELTSQQNSQNRKGAYKNSKSGIRGVCWFKRDKKWVAQIKVNYKNIDLGKFSDIKDAEKAVKEARAKYMPYSQEALA